MPLLAVLRRRRGLLAFLAGIALTLAVGGAVVWGLLADQRRAAGAVSAVLSRALAREVQIERVPALSPDRAVLRGLRLPRAGGWPADLAAEEVEASGPLGALVHGEPAPVRVTVRGPRVEVPAGPGGAPDLEALGGALAEWLAGSLVVDATLTGGSARHGDRGVEFDLALRKTAGQATLVLVLRGPGESRLVVEGTARAEGPATHLEVTARGTLAPLAAWLPPALRDALAGRPAALRVAVDAGPGPALGGRGTLSIGDAVAGEARATLREGLWRVEVPRAEVDLAVAAAAGGLGWAPAGRAALGEGVLTWRPAAGGWPAASAVVEVPRLALPAAGAGAEVTAEGLAARVEVAEGPGGPGLRGVAEVERARVAGLEASGRARYVVALAGGAVTRVDLDQVAARVAGLALRGQGAWDARARRLDGRLEGDDLAAADLVRRLAPGWLGADDRLRVRGLRVVARGLDPAGLRAGDLTADARAVALGRPDGDLTLGPVAARATLGAASARVSLGAEAVVGALPALRGTLPRVEATARLGRAPAGALGLEEATAAARDAAGLPVLEARLGPGPAPGQLRAAARAPALERLAALWPDIDRRVRGEAGLDLVLAGPGLAEVDGRVTVRVPEAELLGGRVAVRDVEADLPVRRGGAAAPDWGRLAVGEVIGHGLVVRDLATPARLWNRRLALNDLAYALYAGTGRGWGEVELQDAGLLARVKLTGDRVRIEEFVGGYGIRGGTMTGLLRYDLDARYGAGRLLLNGRFEVPEGGAVNIELLNRLLAHASADPTGVLRSAIENLRSFEYKRAEADVRTAGEDVRVSVSLLGRERFGIFPPRVREINVRNLPLSFLARQFPAAS